jgi:hypothetical protein
MAGCLCHNPRTGSVERTGGGCGMVCFGRAPADHGIFSGS